MPLATFAQEGQHIDYTPSSAVDAGDVVVIGDMTAIAARPIAANALGAVTIRGVFRVPKATGSAAAIAAGKKVYWDAGDEVATTTASSHKVLGWTVAAAGDDDDSILVDLQRA